ncbi:MAG: ASKHA domain-containing protein, partial [bacterium]
MAYPVTFLPAAKTVHVEANATLLQAAVQAGLLIDTPCGGGGICAKCRVRIHSGQAATGGSSHRLTADELTRGWRLACGTKVTEPLTVEIPAASQVARLGTILVDGEPISIRRDAHTLGHLGVAFDLGTTSVVGTLFDLHTGLERATHAVMNRQITLGDDVISRIAYVRTNPANLTVLQARAVETLNDILRVLCDECNESPDSIHKLTVAGNTTMQQLLLGIDPSPLGEHPFKPAFTDAQTLAAKHLGLLANIEATLIVFPQIGGFVGGDTVAGLLASHFDSLILPTLLVDIGTNGEIALLKEGAILAASTAAGPAFEGARISQGMRATAGAIDHLWLQNGELHYHVIGETDACGLCGSALVDTVAELLRLGLIDPTGALQRPASITDALAQRLILSENGAFFVLAYDALGTPSVTLTQQDIRELQLASGAIRTGIEALLHKANLTVRDLDSILLAGAFGNYIRRENALRIGLLPPLHYLSIHFIG